MPAGIERRPEMKAMRIIGNIIGHVIVMGIYTAIAVGIVIAIAAS